MPDPPRTATASTRRPHSSDQTDHCTNLPTSVTLDECTTPADKMASLLQSLARRSSELIVKSPTPEAWQVTANLRNQYFYTAMEAMPARVAAASKEWAALRHKVSTRDITLNDVATGASRAVEFYAFYFLGKVIGSRSIPI